MRIENAEFHYPTVPDVQVLAGVSIDVPTNKIVALVGASGCGKSSIISLIERFYDPMVGNVSYNNIDLKDIDNKWYHQEEIAIVQQEPVLFSGTIKENILYGTNMTHLTPKELADAL